MEDYSIAGSMQQRSRENVMLNCCYKVCDTVDPNVFDQNNRTALHTACFQDHPNIVEMLLLRSGGNGVADVHEACLGRVANVAEILLQHSANVNARDGHNYIVSQVSLYH